MSRYIRHVIYKRKQYLTVLTICLFIIILFNLISNLAASKANFSFFKNTNTVVEPIYPAGYFIRGTNLGSFNTIDYGLASAVDLDQNVYVGGKYNNRPVLFKRDVYGRSIWTYTPVGPGGGEIRSITIDSYQNILITGNFISSLNFGNGLYTSAGGYDIFVAKLSPEGQHLWSQKYGSSAFSSTPTETGNSISIDSTDNSVIFTALFGDGGPVNFGGGFVTPSYGYDTIIVKLTTDGQFVWHRHIGGSAGTYPESVIVDKVGSVYLTGTMYSPTKFDTNLVITNYAGINNDAFLVKYSANNVFQWVNHYGQQTTQAGGKGLIIDNDGDIVMVGYSQGINNFGGLMLTNRGGDDIILAKYNGYNGVHKWSKSIGSLLSDYSRGIGIDNSNRITIVGNFNNKLDFSDGNFLYTSNPSSYWQSFIAHFESNGNLLWARCFGIGQERLESVAVRPDGRIFTIGRMNGTLNFNNFYLTNTYQDILYLELAE